MVLLSIMFFICGVLAIYFYAKFTETLTLGELSVNIDYLLYNTEEVEIATTLFTDGDFCNVSLNAWENQYNYFYTYQFTLDVEPKIINGRTMVPVRAASELLGLKVDWNGDTNTVTITA